MEWGANRISATKEAIQEIFRIATSVNAQRGVNLHFFDDEGSTRTSHIGSDFEIKDVISRVGLTKGEPVPCPLHEKVLATLVELFDKEEVQNPTIVAIITNGGVSRLYDLDSLATVD